MERPLHAHPATTSRQGLTWLRLYALLRQWQRNYRTRRQLARLDARQLADAGISLAQREQELDKPFWR